jgi:hypothetical protein
MPDPEQSFTINEFCAAEKICRATFYSLQRQGLGPDTILVGSRQRITAEARKRWHQERERTAVERHCGVRGDRSRERHEPAARP